MHRAGRVASLGMYDFPWLQAANDTLWHAIAGRLAAAGLVDTPETLDRSRPLEDIWRDPGLLLGQTCGFPLLHALRDAVRVIATPCYGFVGCEREWHRSFLVVSSADRGITGLADLRGRRFAMNAPDSNTGMNLPRATLAPFARGAPMLAEVRVTGGHLESLRAVRDGAVDAAAIDCVTHALIVRDRPELLSGTRILAWTPATPALPLVTALATSASDIERLRRVIADPDLKPLWNSLGVRGLAWTSRHEYAPVDALSQAADEAGYPALA